MGECLLYSKFSPGKYLLYSKVSGGKVSLIICYMFFLTLMHPLEVITSFWYPNIIWGEKLLYSHFPPYLPRGRKEGVSHTSIIFLFVLLRSSYQTFHFMGPLYEIYISQMIRYSRACGSYQDFLDRGLLLTRKLLNQGFLLVKLKSSLRTNPTKNRGWT
jgi:hypothetical protein